MTPGYAEGAPVELHGVASLRSRALALLEKVSRQAGAPTAARSDVITRLQHVANDLGVIETLVAAPAAPQGARTSSGPAPLSPDPEPPAEARQDLDLGGAASAVLGLAATSMQLAVTREDEAERWLRVLRRHGQIADVLKRLGVPETPLETPPDPSALNGARRRRPGSDAVDIVGEFAREMARARDAEVVSTGDVAFAVLKVYGRRFDRALYVYGITREQLLGELAASATPQQI